MVEEKQAIFDLTMDFVFVPHHRAPLPRISYKDYSVDGLYFHRGDHMVSLKCRSSWGHLDIIKARFEDVEMALKAANITLSGFYV